MIGKITAFLLDEKVFAESVFDISLTPGATVIGLGYEMGYPVIYAFIDDNSKKTEKRRFALAMTYQAIHAKSMRYIDKFEYNGQNWFLLEVYNQDLGERLEKGIMEQLNELEDNHPD